MLGGGGGVSRISHHLRECNHHHSLGLGFCSTGIVKLSSFIFRPSYLTLIGHNHRFQQRLVSSSSLQSKSPGEIPIVSDCFRFYSSFKNGLKFDAFLAVCLRHQSIDWALTRCVFCALTFLIYSSHVLFGQVADHFSLSKSQQEDDLEPPSEGSSAVAGGIVALGKFDALHVGHRELAIQASKVGTPYLLSFVGIAEVLGWEPRAPIVAKCDRSRVLASWAAYCGNVAPSEFHIEFSSVRHLNPQQFVEKLSNDLQVCGVVAGENYRFGYKAAGDASDLVRLCEEYGIGAYIINSVMDRSKDLKNTDSIDTNDRGQVSSTRVRHALAIGDMKYVSELLGRRHRLLLILKDQKGFTRSNTRWKMSASKSCLLNLPPKDGFYENCFLILDNENPVRCDVFIDSTYIHLEMDDLVGLSSSTICQDFHILSVEFGD